MTGTKEFYDLVAEFEKYAKQNALGRLDREAKGPAVPSRYFYQDGNVNKAFQAYMAGYQLHKCMMGMEQE